MKRILSFFLTVILLLFCVAGCKNEAAPTPAEPTAPTESSAPTTPTTPSEPTQPPLKTDPRFASLEQEAVVKTALAFLARGKYIQYDNTRFSETAEPVVHRWEVGMKAPEDYTSQSPGYSNCAAFTHDVYLAALDYEIGAYTTATLSAKGTSQRRYTYIPTGKETAEEKAAVEADFRANLEIGDIIVVRYNGDHTGNGHAMLYVGTEVLKNGNDIIHSTGGSYSYKDFTDKAEAAGTVQTMSTKSLFSPSSSLYTFSKLQSLSLVRPLRTYKGGVPENTQNRIRNLDGIVAEKLSTHTKSMTVNPGEQITFTFSVTNKNDRPVTLKIQDTVSANCVYVTGAETVTGDVLRWQLTVPAKSKASVSYTVQVKTDAAYGDTIPGDGGTVGGVKTPCPKVYIAKTLTNLQQAKIKTAASEITGKQGMGLADAIYEKAVGKATGLPTDFAALDACFFELRFKTEYRLKGERGMLDLIPAGLFGGRRLCHRTMVADYMRLEYARTRLPQVGDLIAGDILLAVGGPNSGGEHLYLFTGEKLLNLNTGKTQNAQPLLNTLLGYDRFVIIRPSIGM